MVKMNKFITYLLPKTPGGIRQFSCPILHCNPMVEISSMYCSPWYNQVPILHRITLVVGPYPLYGSSLIEPLRLTGWGSIIGNAKYLFIICTYDSF